VACVTNSTLAFDGLLEYVLKDFGIESPGESRVQRLVALNNFLIERRRAGQRSVLVLDEAQNFSPSTLEEVRLLSNFESPTEKLLQIMLVGQPELKTTLQRAELRQLQQRVGIQCSIRPLTSTEVRDYIRTRLRVAGAPDLNLFTDVAMDRIARYTGGVPRLVNSLCDHCLLIGYADRKRRVERDTVDQAIGYFSDARRARSLGQAVVHALRRPARGWMVGMVAVAFLAGAIALTVRPEASDIVELVRGARELLVK
jgi:general secretion pathway protein A